MTNHERIIELNKIWYDLIGGEHHKDRDCHFDIYIHYFYGDHVEYAVEHSGYIRHNYEVSHWDTLEEAELELVSLLKDMILEQINFYLEHYGDNDWDQHNLYDKEKLEDIKKTVYNT